jgi:hypothetical protein
MWFVDKLGPAPGAASSPQQGRPNGAAKAQAPTPQRTQAAPAKAAPPPEPEKKKKKGWF